MVISSIDIGTNTVLLLIAQINPKNNKIIPLLNEYRIPRIGKNLNQTGEISPDSVEKLKEILFEYKSISRNYKSEVILATGTAAFRKALNKDKIIDYLLNVTGIKINVISGREEARFAYLGVVSGVYDNKDRLIIDIGGGSTEIIAGRNNELSYIKSFNTGVVTACEKYNKSNNLINDLNTYFEKEFNSLNNLSIESGNTYAIAGTPTTLACIKNDLTEFNESVEGSTLTKVDIENFAYSYMSSPEYYHNKFKSVLTGREDLIVPGSLILLRIMRNLNIDELFVSTRGIRHGAITDYLNNYI